MRSIFMQKSLGQYDTISSRLSDTRSEDENDESSFPCTLGIHDNGSAPSHLASPCFARNSSSLHGFDSLSVAWSDIHI